MHTKFDKDTWTLFVVLTPQTSRYTFKLTYIREDALSIADVIDCVETGDQLCVPSQHEGSIDPGFLPN